MATAIGWVALILMTYVFIALFFVLRGAKRVLKIVSSGGDLSAEAQAVQRRSYRTRVVWVKRHKDRLPVQARELANRVIAIDLTCWISVAILFALYGVQLVAL